MASTKTSSSEFGHLFRLTAPVALAQLANMTMQLVDTLFAGRLGPAAIGGIGVGNALFATLMVVGIGLLLGLDYLASHAYGAGRLTDCHRVLVQALYLATAIALPFMFLLFFSSGVFMRFGVTPEVAHQAGGYLKTVCWSLWPMLLFMAFRQYLQAMGVAAPVLWIMLFGNVVNALGNYAFVFGHFGFRSMGLAGSGVATTVARVCTLVAIIAYTLWRDDKLKLGLVKAPLRVSKKHIRELIGLGLPAGTQMLLEVGVFALATLLIGRLDAVSLAAHQIVLHIASTTFMIPLGLSTASAVRVGQALGAGHRHRSARIGWTAIAMGVAFMSLSGVTMYALATPILRAFTSDFSVIQIGKSLLLIAALFQLSDGVQVVATGVLRGIGDTKSSMYSNLFGHWVIGLPIGYTLCFPLGWGAKGLWTGLSIGLTVVAALLAGVWWAKSGAFAAERRKALA